MRSEGALVVEDQIPSSTRVWSRQAASPGQLANSTWKRGAVTVCDLVGTGRFVWLGMSRLSAARLIKYHEGKNALGFCPLLLLRYTTH